MNLNIRPISTISGKIYLPASKSYSIRAHIIAACGGRSNIIGSSDCDDAAVARRVAVALKKKSKQYDVGESGTTLRFLLPLLPLHVSKATVKGKGTLVGRPNHHLCHALRQQGMDITGVGDKESIPIHYKGGLLTGGKITIDGSLSSQFISALLIAAPRLARDTTIQMTGKQLVSSDYILMTRQILNKAGIKILTKGPRTIVVKGNQRFLGLKNFHVPSDYGLAAFPMAAAALLDSNVVLEGYFNDEFIQSDGHILGFLKKMGVRFVRTRGAIKMKGPFSLKGGTFSLKDCPDLVPIMSVLALFAKTPTRLINIHHARAKESDRISDLRKELLKVGADVRETKDALIIHPKPAYKANQVLDPHHDHRLAMAFSILGLKMGVKVLDINCVAKSYPSFVKDMKILGMA